VVLCNVAPENTAFFYHTALKCENRVYALDQAVIRPSQDPRRPALADVA
jgi:hypothetical protein